jgi:hypothetical protein
MLECDFTEKLELVILTLDLDNLEITSTAQSNIKNFQELLQVLTLKFKLKDLSTQPYICLLKKRLFRTNCISNDLMFEGYCRLIAFAY